MYSIRYADGTWLAWDGYAVTSPLRAWRGSRAHAERMVLTGIALGECTIEITPLTISEWVALELRYSDIDDVIGRVGLTSDQLAVLSERFC